MKRERGVCAICGSHNVDWGPLHDTGDAYVYYKIICKDCGAKSEERYDLMFLGTYREDEELDAEEDADD